MLATFSIVMGAKKLKTEQIKAVGIDFCVHASLLKYCAPQVHEIKYISLLDRQFMKWWLLNVRLVILLAKDAPVLINRQAMHPMHLKLLLGCLLSQLPIGCGGTKWLLVSLSLTLCPLLNIIEGSGSKSRIPQYLSKMYFISVDASLNVPISLMGCEASSLSLFFGVRSWERSAVRAFWQACLKI